MFTNQLAEFSSKITYEDLPQRVINEANKCIIDTLGICIKGSTYNSSKVLYSCLETPSIRGKCTLWGTNERASFLEAALYNATTAHTVEMDDWHREGTVHPGCVVIPAAIAVAEEVAASGKELILSIVIGYEIMTRIGMATQGTQQDRGFHPTGTCGVFGAAVASGKLYNLSENQMKMALGIAGSFTGGLLEYQSNGAWTKRLNSGNASKLGTFAAKLAKNGFVGPETILEGRYGFLKAYSNSVIDKSLELLYPNGESFQIEKISRKPYPSCRHTHSSVDAIIKLVNEHSITPHEVKQIKVETYDRAIEATVKPETRKYRPTSQVDGQFSLPYCIALALHFGQVSPEHFSTKYITDDILLKTAAKVKISSTKDLNDLYPAHNPSRVKLILETGVVYTKTIYNAKGDPENPLTNEEIEKKFSMLVYPVLGYKNGNKLLSQLNNLENVTNVGEWF